MLWMSRGERLQLHHSPEEESDLWKRLGLVGDMVLTTVVRWTRTASAEMLVVVHRSGHGGLWCVKLRVPVKNVSISSKNHRRGDE